MAVGVVDAFEAVDVEIEEAETRAVAAGAFDRMAKVVDEGGAAAQPGEGIRDHSLLQARLDLVAAAFLRAEPELEQRGGAEHEHPALVERDVEIRLRQQRRQHPVGDAYPHGRDNEVAQRDAGGMLHTA